MLWPIGTLTMACRPLVDGPTTVGPTIMCFCFKLWVGVLKKNSDPVFCLHHCDVFAQDAPFRLSISEGAPWFWPVTKPSRTFVVGTAMITPSPMPRRPYSPYPTT